MFFPSNKSVSTKWSPGHVESDFNNRIEDFFRKVIKISRIFWEHLIKKWMFVQKMQMFYGINECSFHKPGDICEKSLNISLNLRKKLYKKLVFQKKRLISQKIPTDTQTAIFTSKLKIIFEYLKLFCSKTENIYQKTIQKHPKNLLLSRRKHFWQTGRNSFIRSPKSIYSNPELVIQKQSHKLYAFFWTRWMQSRICPEVYTFYRKFPPDK